MVSASAVVRSRTLCSSRSRWLDTRYRQVLLRGHEGCQRRQDLESVDFRHVEVENDQVDLLALHDVHHHPWVGEARGPRVPYSPE